jgi:large subunit ribosomal protein L9
MKVILNQTVPKVGKEGQVVTVADGFARNYLFPRRLAIVATKAQVQALERRQARVQAKVAEQKSSADALKAELEGKSVRIAAKVGADGGRLFGAVTASDVAEAIKAQLGHDVDRRKVALVEPIKRLGDHQVMVDLHRDVDVHLTVTVFDSEAPATE